MKWAQVALHGVSGDCSEYQGIARRCWCGDMTGISQYGPPPCRRGPTGARSGERAIRRMRRDHRNEIWEEHVPARPIRYLAAVALWAVPTHAGAQNPPAPEVLRVTRTADDGGEGSLRWAIERNNAAPGRLRIELDPAGQAPHVI